MLSSLTLILSLLAVALCSRNSRVYDYKGFCNHMLPKLDTLNQLAEKQDYARLTSKLMGFKLDLNAYQREMSNNVDETLIDMNYMTLLGDVAARVAELDALPKPKTVAASRPKRRNLIYTITEPMPSGEFDNPGLDINDFTMIENTRYHQSTNNFPEEKEVNTSPAARIYGRQPINFNPEISHDDFSGYYLPKALLEPESSRRNVARKLSPRHLDQLRNELDLHTSQLFIDFNKTGTAKLLEETYAMYGRIIDSFETNEHIKLCQNLGEEMARQITRFSRCKPLVTTKFHETVRVTLFASILNFHLFPTNFCSRPPPFQHCESYYRRLLQQLKKSTTPS